VTVAVVAAHPDDEILGVGGTLARHVQRGEEVHAIVVADGATSRYEPDLVQELQDSGRMAADVLGFASIHFLGLPDQRLDAMPLFEVTQRVEDMLQLLRPQIVYTHFCGDVNADHGVLTRCVTTACRPFRLPDLRMLASFETPSSTEWALPTTAAAFVPTQFVDITETIEQKLDAMDCYQSELRDYPHPRSRRSLRERAAYWGSAIGRAAAEPFVILRQCW
jgi:LmbE family N-acetylglucosaminyl deacetylase